jgi:hypothetical protein
MERISRIKMKIFSLSHLVELAARLPPPENEVQYAGYHAVIRLPVRDWDAVLDADHPERRFDARESDFVEFEIIPWKDTRGIVSPRWVLRGLVAI